MKKWRLTIGINHYYLTELEKDFYLKSVQKGEQFAVMKDKILSTKFMDLVSEDVIELADNLDEGKWRCKAGSWHGQNESCTHGRNYQFDKEEQKYYLLEKMEQEVI